MQAVWHSERQAKPPARVVPADDTLKADKAYKLACEGTAFLWRGDFHNARQLIEALARRVDQSRTSKKHKEAPTQPGVLFHQHRQAQAQKANILHKILVQIEPDGRIALNRAPDVKPVLHKIWGACAIQADRPTVVSFKELQGLTGAYEWSKKGIEIPALGAPPANRIYPDYGVYSPVRGEYLDLIAQAELPEKARQGLVFDIGTGTGVLAAILARRGCKEIIATEVSTRALACAQFNFEHLGVSETVDLRECDLFPQGQADLVVCNPPWIPAKPSSPIEQAVYDPGSSMLKGFLQGVPKHLKPDGQAWLVLSNLAELLGLREAGWLEEEIRRCGLKVAKALHTKPRHGKASHAADPLAAARSQEVTSLWCLEHA